MRKTLFFFLFLLFCSALIAENEEIVTRIYIEAKKGVSIYSMDEGSVETIGYNPDIGNYIVTKYTDSKLTITYGNLSKMKVKKGQIIKRGTKLGTVGSTGATKGSGITLLIEFDENGMKFNRTDVDVPQIIHLFEK